MTAQLSRKRVLIVGGGATGMAAAYALSQHPDKFDVVLYERSAHPGGMATSVPIDKAKYGAEYINDGVQGASPVFYNTYALFDRLGFKASDVGMQVSFGRDPETDFWTNVFPSPVIDEFNADIKKFGWVLKVIKALELVFAMISVSAMLRIFRFSKACHICQVALFFGTGNQTPFISSAILERVFMDPNMRLFEYSSDTFLASIPRMCAFPHLSELYSAWKSIVEEQGKGSTQIITCREVTRARRSSKGVYVWSCSTQGTDNSQSVVEPGREKKEFFDEIVFCCDADAALQILGNDATWLEKKILGNVKVTSYLWDITVTHSDLPYMEKYYRVRYDPELRSKKGIENSQRQERYSFAEKHFEPLYFIRNVPEDKSKIEMSFDLTFNEASRSGSDSANGYRNEKDATSVVNDDSIPKRLPLERHVFQTIFLDHSLESRKFWTKGAINPDEVILEKWWKQQSHRWQHYAGTVPWMGLINGKNHTQFAGAWTVINMHEIAVVSGFGAAYRLGASYPFRDNQDCKRLFALCLGVNHMMRMRREDRDGYLS
ncbi:hypothetical protein AGABI1DRAFT_129177 [Agaricus bisporus var. burnettii JB137-S8]|uniref:Amine oxidase domain-containing protein n=1 Tax=Agaricus bisporus var. burnettii (strain JB137-S8 / ATCC MYA-4627 / FGSC 10392) TaxID=597362 RepID=K5XUV7_AGABU|nr:uncharacterized protein AGABI1DRAFT_129177 [Agaricus bisporus var. burnettii JB137-S8]EKM78905.1 hypothetical protein AGABI1DRAFT_129177 [Agaricus bisporus var. burnettii JB137-S8]